MKQASLKFSRDIRRLSEDILASESPRNPALVAAMDLASSLQLFMVGVYRTPEGFAGIKGVRPYFQAGNEDFAELWRCFIRSKRLTIFITFERIDNVKVIAKWFGDDEEDMEVAEMTALFDPKDGKEAQIGLTTRG